MPINVLLISNYRNYVSFRPEVSIFIGLDKLGFKGHIMTYTECSHIPEIQESGINLVNFHPSKKYDKGEIKRIRDFIIEEKIDVLQLVNSRSIVNGIAAAKGLPVKVVLYRGYVGNIHWYDPTAYLKFLHPRVDKIFCNSKGVQEEINRQLFFDKSKTVAIHKGHNVAWYEKYEPYDIRSELGLSPDTFLVINVANNRKMKGIPYLLQAFNDLPNDLPIHLLLVGENMDDAPNMKAINKGGKKDKIHILGFRDNILNIVAACNVFASASIKGESTTKSLIEAMSLEIAPIVTNIPGNRDLAVHEESGLMIERKNSFQLKEAMLRLYNDQEFTKQLGKNAKQRIISHFNSEQTVVEVAEFYKSLVSK
ncbi:MAG: glycosyltransferase family 4 protein [Cyclobacteriaceae bacterium]